MSSALKKIFSGENDEEVHNEFIKFGKGVFENRYLLEAKKQKNKWAIKTSAEFSNFLVRSCLEKASGEIEIKGIIVSTFPVSDKAEFEIEKVKKYMGIQQVVIKTTTTTPDKVLSLMNEFPKAHFGLSFKTDSCDLKIKAKTPKSGKPGKKGGEGPKADFCSLKTTDRSIVQDLFFDFPDFDFIVIKHTLNIKKIELPEGEQDPVKIRALAKRSGTMKREVNVNGEEFIEEKEFSA